MNEADIKLINMIEKATGEKLRLFLVLTDNDILTGHYAEAVPQLTVNKTAEDYRTEVENSIKECSSLMRENLENGIFCRIEYLFRDKGPVAQTAIGLAILEYLYPELKGLWSEIGEPGITVELSAKIAYGIKNPMLDFMEEIRDAERELSGLFYLAPQGHSELVRTVISMDERMWKYITGSDDISGVYASAGHLDRNPGVKEILFHENLLDNLREKLSLIKPSENCLIQLSGKPGAGKRFLISKAEAERNNDIVYINYEILKVSELATAKKTVWYFYRECRFYQAVPVFYGLSDELVCNREEAEGFLSLCIYPYTDMISHVYVCCGENVEIAPYTDIPVFKLAVQEPTRDERISLWKTCLDKLNFESVLDVDTLGAKYHLTASQIYSACSQLKRREEAGLPSDDKAAGEICSELIPAPSAGSIQKINAVYTLEDIKLPAASKKILTNVCSHIWQRHKVFDEWGLDKVYSYGKGVSILFCGPPGTGKTMAAQVIASMLELPLYRVDLSQITSKYVGESEKKLEEVFSAAESSNMILFFDEADSIFGKRSEVKEANDKYANTEVSYILQRMETYEGVVILATNFKINIDDAFMRRMRYVLEFNMPDAKLRYEIWKSCFTENVPTGDIDFKFLADKFELSGGNIKNIVLNAVFAAAQADEPVNMLHILEALRMERIKTGVMMIPKDFGDYAPYMEEIMRQNY